MCARVDALVAQKTKNAPLNRWIYLETWIGALFARVSVTSILTNPQNRMTKQLLILASLVTTAALPSCVDPYSQAPHHRRGPADTVYRSGYEVRTLPQGYRTEVINGTRYYSHDGTYYRSHSGRYVVVERPNYHRPSTVYHRETILRTLPPGYRSINRGGIRYYQYRENFYRRSGSGYIIVDRPY